MNRKIIFSLIFTVILLSFLHNFNFVYGSQTLTSNNRIDFVDGYGKVYYLAKDDIINVKVSCEKETTKAGCNPAYYYYLGNKDTLDQDHVTLYPISKDFKVPNTGYYIIYVYYDHYLTVEKTDKKTSITNKITNNTTTPSSSSYYSLTIGSTNIDASGNDHYNLNGEWVSIKCTSGSVNLSGWNIKDEYGWTYSFPSITIREGQTIKIYTGCGTNTSTSLYWCHDGAIWNNDGDTVKLIKPDGSLYGSWKVHK